MKLLLLALALTGCATVKADVKTVAEVCRPELLPDVERAFPLVVALSVCEASSGDCTSEVNALALAGKADATTCALAELHQATITVTAVVPTAAVTK
jgi:hypothetical protein